LFDISRGAAAPNQADVQSYLDQFQQIDPAGYAQRVALAGQQSDYLQNVLGQYALGSQLDPGTVREVEQGTRAAQAARGNVYGTPQLVQETMQRGTAGEQRLQQRQAAAGQALGGMTSYLGSGQGLGDIANTLYQQGYGRYANALQSNQAANLAAWQTNQGANLNAWQANQNARLNAQNQALSYLGSGQTPYQAGASYYDRAQAQAASAAQGGPQYQPAALGGGYTGGGASSFPAYGLDMSSNSLNWYNMMNAYNRPMGSTGGSGTNWGAVGAKAGMGALSGAVSGLAAGGVGAIPGAIIGGLGGAASGFSG
jgi:hypothetical protein